MKKRLFFIGIFVVLIGISFYMFKNYFSDNSSSGFVVRDFDYNKDHQAVDNLFHKDDNWYWMISTQNTDTYSIDFALRYKTSSQHIKKQDMVLKVCLIDGKIAGFFSYYPKIQGSNKIWQLLFLIVDQDFRRQGIARKLLTSAVDDMVKRGAIRIDIATRNNNFRAQNLYKSFGAKLVDSDDGDFVHFSWYKPKL
ncbi:GNAT family N-acetyltransferase [Candidatus Dependentiae bacterium]|nr:GNAT family N-acetyltransferase [Candidatus Dependentiae bacterium]